MKQSTEELKKIIENAPEEGYTHFSDDGDYRYYDEYGCYTGIHSLSDIKEIVELREKLDSAFVIDSNEEVTKLTAKQLGIEL